MTLYPLRPRSQQTSRQETKRQETRRGFTIVELLIVIVVIGILAAITIVAYNGIQKRAVATTLKSDLKQASTVLEKWLESCVGVQLIGTQSRNRADDVEINKRFDQFGVRLISTSENIDQTPGGLLLHGIMSSIAEFYSKNLSNEVKKGMSEKVRAGGSVSRAPIGYLNVRELTDGNEVRTVEVDPERAHLVTWAFETYAKGDSSVRSLTAELVKRGLTMAKTAKLPEKPVETRQVHQILTNPYYLGVVTYKGSQHPGNHEQLIDQETFKKVQDILKSKINGERTNKHAHYLKSTLFCGECGMRMIVQVAKPRTGEEYPYYSCLGGHSKRTACTLRSINFLSAEDL